MGQRFQSVFILPPIFMNEKNPNNREEKVLIFHNQWLYGYGALNINLGIMERLKKAISKKKLCGAYGKDKNGFINHYLETSLRNAIKFISLQQLHNETSFNESKTYNYGEENEIKLSDALLSQDNNNGFFICIVDKNLKMKYTFISGIEDEPQHNYKTPEEYLKLFYENKIKYPEIYKSMEKTFKKFEKFESIPKKDIEKTIKEMNEKEVF